jgi:O-antigen ligase
MAHERFRRFNTMGRWPNHHDMWKAALLLVCGVLASVGILLEYPQIKIAALLGVAIWSFARAYYFAFYVIEHYVDPSYRFSGLWSFALYLISRKR